MSMRAPSRSQSRRQRALVISLLLVVVVAVASLGGSLAARWKPKLGLDLAGGLSVTYRPAHKVSSSDLSETVSVLSNRVAGIGVSGAQVSTQGGDIVVQIPGVKNGRAVLKTIGQTAQLLFRPVLCTAPAYSPAAAKQAKAQAKGQPLALPNSCQAQYQITAANLGAFNAQGNPTNNIPEDPALAVYPSTPSTKDAAGKVVLLPGLPGSGGARYLLGVSPLTGHAVKGANAQVDSLGNWVVNYTLTGSGSPGFDKLAQANFHQEVAIELDGIVQSAPIIQPTQASFTSFAGQGQISGSSFTEANAKNLALAMQFGSLPVRLNPLTTETVSPTLGSSALKAGLGAGVAGLLLVLLYTIVYYRLLGVVVLSGLAVTGALLWSIISALGHTSIAPSFDLAGVTGIIVSIGITVDSYIVYFERLKDETRSGRTVRTSVDRGFQSAWRTVLAADLVSFAAAAVLFILAIGEVKGFAFFLGLSTLLDVFMTYFFTRPLVVLLGRNERLSSARFGISRGLAVQTGAEA
ncbi:MAG TPA: protein translocase subunit SecD [Acidimicrobiales bacterium]|nr:protein translocase subunit SecD [Acidimicrobiales bacterium]